MTPPGGWWRDPVQPNSVLSRGRRIGRVTSERDDVAVRSAGPHVRTHPSRRRRAKRPDHRVRSLSARSWPRRHHPQAIAGPRREHPYSRRSVALRANGSGRVFWGTRSELDRSGQADSVAHGGSKVAPWYRPVVAVRALKLRHVPDPSAAELPPLLTAEIETPTTRNPLGSKGVGEAAPSGPACAGQRRRRHPRLVRRVTHGHAAVARARLGVRSPLPGRDHA